jgi:imidazole glycerol-phosphate synthase subunit HisH
LIAVINYGLGNLRSVSKALESLGAEVKVTEKAKDILKAEAVILPGVGAFQQGMKNIRRLKLETVIRQVVESGKPFLGICLGLQMLFSESEEHGRHKGLDIVKGRVVKITGVNKIPHMGWNEVKIPATKRGGSAKISGGKNTFGLFNNVPDNSYFYFVHSYYVKPKDKSVIAGTTKYGQEFTSVIHQGNIWGVQFHPEKSYPTGLKILKNFIKQIR